MKLRLWLPGWALLAAIVVAYIPTYRAGFVWNDSDYVTAPPLRSLEGLGKIWTKLGATEQYYPVLHSAFWIQHRLWGDSPIGYHLTTVALHAFAALLLWRVLLRLGVRGAWIGATLFALHPVCVESVAWISEQKNTLSLFLYLAAALAYLRHRHSPSPLRYGVATGIFVAALLSKSVCATLPAALLVVLWWQKGRITWRDARPLVPWFIAGAAFGLFSAWADELRAKVDRLQARVPDVVLDVNFQLNRPPMPRTAGTAELLQRCQTYAADAGFTLKEAPMTGGASDANFTAALGLPTLDGLGADGDGAHTLNEHILVSTLAQRQQFWVNTLRGLNEI